MNDLILKPNKRRQRYSLEINDNAELIVKTPIRPSKKVIKKLIDENQTWIIKQKQRAEDTQKRLLDWNDDTAIFYRGKKFSLHHSNESTIIFAKESITIPNRFNKNKFINYQAKLYLPERCLDIAEHMGLKTGEIKIRKMKSCWGTCHRNRNITLNEALIQVPDWVSDYVMIHECAHLKHFNHSKQFWALVAKFTNQTKPAKQWLKEHQPALIN